MSRGDRLRFAFLALHPHRGRSLLERFGSVGEVLRRAARGAIEGIDPSRVLDHGACRAAMDRAGCRALLRGDDGYPASLAELGDPPDVIFVRGSVPVGPGVAVVGTRRCTAYGRRLARSFGAAIGAAGWPVVSGLARGIDGAAHRGTIDVGGIGVAVLGSGSDVIYPRDHRDLHDGLLAAGGAIISEYPPGTRPHGWRFPPRNRIISGLSAAVVVVEAGVTGGALITANRAGEQGRALFAVPGDVDRPASVGCNLLIRDGAIPALGPEDLIEGLSLVLGPPAGPPKPGRRHPPDGIDGRVLQAATPACSPDDLAERLGLPIGQVLAAVARLELIGHMVVRGALVEAVGAPCGSVAGSADDLVTKSPFRCGGVRTDAYGTRTTAGSHGRPGRCLTGGTPVLMRLYGLINRDEGATMVEYGLMVALIAVVALAAVTLLGGNVSAMFQKIANALTP